MFVQGCVYAYFHVRLSDIASNVYCNADMQYSARTVQIFVATYVVITFLETRDVSNSAAK